MKKIIKLLFTIALIFILNKNVYASSVSIKSSSNSVNRGSSVTVTATVSADSGIYTVAGSVYCSGSGIENGIDLTYEDLNTANKNLSRSIKITPTSSGTITCKTSNVRLRELAAKDGEYTLGDNSITINVTNNNSSGGTGTTNETITDIKEKSSDNLLKSLNIEGYDITPKFDKDTTEYKLEVDESVEKINVKAVANSDKAEVSGIGEQSLSQGENTIEVKVSAENGNEKVYKIIVTVKDQHPIEVNIENKKYTIVKKNNDIIKKLDYYDEKVIKINDQDVISYINSKTKVRLVILKDENNQTGYYIYNEQTNKYSKYKTITVGSITLQLLDAPTLLNHYQKYQTTIKDETVDIYKVKESHKVGLIYGTNVKTGNTGYYVYDTDEETLSKYYNEEVKEVNRELSDLKDKAMIVIGIISGIAIIFIIISIVKTIKIKRMRKINNP